MTRLSVISAVAAFFFLPWAVVDFHETKTEKQFSGSAQKSLAKAFGRKPARAPGFRRPAKGLTSIPTRITGYQIPILANRHQAKVALRLVELFTKQRGNAEPLSWAVYLVPGLAIACGFALLRRPRRELVLPLGALCGLAASAGFWTLLTTDTRKEFAITVGPGVWISLAALAALAAVAGAFLRHPAAHGIMPTVTNTP